ncbi:MAG: DUF1902 domain-containing protein [Oscillospiraceae bacterium]|jgi:hypothetical protein|nr:DUF1902 domain-containing protein [Oscillospiraceae bacterium]
MKYIVNLNWDDDAQVWYSECDNVPLVFEDASLDELIRRVTEAAPELLELNGLPKSPHLCFALNRELSLI